MGIPTTSEKDMAHSQTLNIIGMNRILLLVKYIKEIFKHQIS